MGKALDRLVGQHGALGLQHQAGDDIFRRDQFDPVALPTQLAANRLAQFRVRLEAGGEITLVQIGHYRLPCHLAVASNKSDIPPRPLWGRDFLAHVNGLPAHEGLAPVIR